LLTWQRITENVKRFVTQNRILLLLVSGAFFARLWFVPSWYSPIEIRNWGKTGYAVATGHLIDFYNLVPQYRYPPIWGYLLGLAYRLDMFVDTSGRISPFDATFLLFAKLPIIIADLVAGLIIYKLIKSPANNRKQALLISGLYLFNPWLVFVTGKWGHFDGICAFFLITAVYLLVQKRGKTSAIATGLAMSTKQFAYPFGLVLSLLLWRKQGWRQGAIFFVISYGVLTLFSTPFLIFDREAYLDALIYTLPEDASLRTRAGIWAVLDALERFIPEIAVSGPLPFYIFYGILLTIITLFTLFKLDLTPPIINDVALTLSLMFLTFSPQIHTNYFVLCIPFICTGIGLNHHKIWYAITFLPFLCTWIYTGLPFEDPTRFIWLLIVIVVFVGTLFGMIAAFLSAIRHR
jgi:Gpi18-like mannosyltransferase